MYAVMAVILLLFQLVAATGGGHCTDTIALPVFFLLYSLANAYKVFFQLGGESGKGLEVVIAVPLPDILAGREQR